ncbi:protein of unknown function [Desulfonispora thiosulfatigenes DSM 11270]|uniref:DUF370 domain-containing protein n=1 Tax=Desulfonispora thiosulfatigenes DSM 11270 TaxID=656914 RepID=A0A1W1V2B1_DESTI|nr:extracellular matrix/biofilm biosynthesis regulator RemA family protein [Desulfonispora thiosulfatigenes]SMB87489.1 protein of unknown function [Desulfonispora thiosulfatigenes DSM 11270]
MFLHIGEDIVIPKKDIIGIFDKNTTTRAKTTKEYLELASLDNLIKQVGSDEKVKTFIITSKFVYLSPISSVTLNKRFNKAFELK